MSIKASVTQFVDIYSRFFNSEPVQFLTSGPQFSDYDGPTPDEVISFLDFIKTAYDPLILSGEIAVLPKSTFNNLIGQIQAINNQYTQLTSSRDQSSYQNFANAVDQFVYHTRMFGVPFLAIGGAQIETQKQALLNELATLTKNNTEVENLKRDVRTLITPAIAGSLSDAFKQRRNSIFKNRIFWLFICIFLGFFATTETFKFVNILTSSIAELKSSPANQTSVWVIIAIRTIILIPIFAAFGFSFAQYKKERDFEEEYAHKAAVANSLPNYGDLAREAGIRDQIVTAATTVIFSSPSEQARNAETSNALAGSMKEVVDAMSKALGKK